MTFRKRLSALEAAPPATASINADATHLTETLTRLAGRFPESAAALSLAERIRTMSPAEHCAWSMRFLAEPVSVPQIMTLHGRSMAARGSYANR